MTPEDIVGGQLDAYNAKDIDLFMSFWAEDAQLLAHPDTLLAEGLDAIRARHVERFREPNLFGKLIARMSLDDTVIDQEIVTRSLPEGPGTVAVIAIYQVKDGKIAKAWYKMGAPVLSVRSKSP